MIEEKFFILFNVIIENLIYALVSSHVSFLLSLLVHNYKLGIYTWFSCFLLLCLHFLLSIHSVYDLGCCNSLLHLIVRKKIFLFFLLRLNLYMDISLSQSYPNYSN